MPVLAVDETLARWGDLKDIPWTGILVGNGASCAVWRGFRYRSLYDQSCSVEMTARLTAEAEIWVKATKVLFLHGGLHLYRELSGETIKRGKRCRFRHCWTCSERHLNRPPYRFSSARARRATN